MTLARIRPAHGGDAQALHDVHLAAWRAAFSDHLPEWVLAERTEHGLAQWQEILTFPEGTWIAHRDGEAVGFARAVAIGPGQPRPLELKMLYVLESEYGQATATNLAEISIGDAPALLWVADHNERGQAFYTKLGFEADGGVQVAPQWGDLRLLRMVR